MIDKFFPLKSVTTTWNDKEWMTPKIKSLIRERQKAFQSKNFDLSNHLSKKIKKVTGKSIFELQCQGMVSSYFKDNK